LDVYALSSHFLNATEKHGTAYGKRKQHHCQAGCDELDVICWHHDLYGLKRLWVSRTIVSLRIAWPQARASAKACSISAVTPAFIFVPYPRIPRGSP
jgi:hypothetical protein